MKAQMDALAQKIQSAQAEVKEAEEILRRDGDAVAQRIFDRAVEHRDRLEIEQSEAAPALLEALRSEDMAQARAAIALAEKGGK